MAEKIAAGKSATEKKINFSVLKKHDENIEKIIDTASSVAHYKFNAHSGVWEKTEVEGSLFLYLRKVSPFVVLFIMNRLNKINTRLVLSPDMEIKVQEPFLLCKLMTNEIIGIWFYDQSECQRFGTLLSSLVLMAENETSIKMGLMMLERQKQQQQQQQQQEQRHIQPLQLQQQSQQPPPQQKEQSRGSGSNLLGMFTKAQEEYESKQKAQQQQQQQQQQQRQSKQLRRGSQDANIEQKESTNSVRVEGEEKHKREQDILLGILHGKDVSASTNKNNNFSINNNTTAADKRTSKNNNKDRTSRTRTVSTSDDKRANDHPTSTEYDKINRFSSQAGDLDIMNKLGIIKENRADVPRKSQSTTALQPRVIGCAELESKLRRTNSNSSNSISTDVLRGSPSLADNIKPSQQQEHHFPNQIPNIDMNKTPTIGNTKPRLMGAASVPITGQVSLISPNVMLTRSGGGGGGVGKNAVLPNQKIAIAANFNQQSGGNKIAKKLFPEDGEKETNKLEPPTGSALNALMSPAAFQVVSSSSSVLQSGENDENVDPNIMPLDALTKEQFKQALIKVLQSDDGFVATLHKAYLEEFQESHDLE